MAPRCTMYDARQPTVVVNGAVAKHLEILRGMPVFSIGVVRRIQHAHAGQWFLRYAIHRFLVAVSWWPPGLWRPHRLHDGTGCESPPWPFMPLGQCITMPFRVPPKITGDLLGPGKWSVSSYCPCCRKMRERIRTTPVIRPRQHPLGSLGVENTVQVNQVHCRCRSTRLRRSNHYLP